MPKTQEAISLNNESFVRPRPGDLLLCYDHTWYDKAIDAVEEFAMLRRGIRPPKGRPIYSHVAVYVGNGYIIEALGNGLVKAPMYNYFGKADVWSKPVGTAARDRIVARAEKMLKGGYTYSWWDVAVQFCRLVFGLHIPWHQKKSLICSVFGYDCWTSIAIKIAQLRNCAPEDIATFGVLQFTGRF